MYRPAVLYSRYSTALLSKPIAYNSCIVHTINSNVCSMFQEFPEVVEEAKKLASFFLDTAAGDVHVAPNQTKLLFCETKEILLVQ